MNFEILKYIGIGVLIGIPIGMAIYAHFSKKELKRHNSYIFYISILWVGFHIYSFFITGKQLDIIFNVVGGIAAGDLLGLKIIAPVIEKVIANLKK